MYYKIIGGVLIQLSDTPRDGYASVIEHEKPEEQDGYYISYDYRIEDNAVHKYYTLNEIIEEEDEYIENTDTE